MLDRSTIVSTLANQRADLEARYRAFPDDIVSVACTQSEDPDGAPWSPKDHLAHLLRVERAFLTMAQSTVGGDAAPVKIKGATMEEKIKQVHRDNERHLVDFTERSVDNVLDELATARTATLDFIAGLSDDQLQLPIPGAPWGDGTIGGVLAANAGHEHQHLAWVDEGLEAQP